MSSSSENKKSLQDKVSQAYESLTTSSSYKEHESSPAVKKAMEKWEELSKKVSDATVSLSSFCEYTCATNPSSNRTILRRAKPMTNSSRSRTR